MGFFDRIVPRRSVSVLPDDRILRYKITGINPGTRRKNTRRVLCGSWEAISDVEARTGLLPPFTCELEMPEVTEAQLELMFEYHTFLHHSQTSNLKMNCFHLHKTGTQTSDGY